MRSLKSLLIVKGFTFLFLLYCGTGTATTIGNGSNPTTTAFIPTTTTTISTITTMFTNTTQTTLATATSVTSTTVPCMETVLHDFEVSAESWITEDWGGNVVGTAMPLSSSDTFVSGSKSLKLTPQNAFAASTNKAILTFFPVSGMNFTGNTEFVAYLRMDTAAFYEVKFFTQSGGAYTHDEVTVNFFSGSSGFKRIALPIAAITTPTDVKKYGIQIYSTTAGNVNIYIDKVAMANCATPTTVTNLTTITTVNPTSTTATPTTVTNLTTITTVNPTSTTAAPTTLSPTTTIQPTTTVPPTNLTTTTLSTQTTRTTTRTSTTQTSTTLVTTTTNGCVENILHSFESTVENWITEDWGGNVVGTATLQSSTDTSVAGNRSLKLTPQFAFSAGNNKAVISYLNGAGINFTGNIEFVLYLRMETASFYEVKVFTQSGGGYTHNEVTYNFFSGSTGFSRLTLPISMIATPTDVKKYGVQIYSTTAGSANIYIDKASLSNCSTPTTTSYMTPTSTSTQTTDSLTTNTLVTTTTFFTGRDIQWLATNGQYIINRDQPNVIRVLRGVNVCGMEYNQNEWGASLVNSIADNWNVNIIRLPIRQEWWINNESGTYRAKIQNIVSWFKAKGVYVLIDLQWINGGLPYLPDANSTVMWDSIADTFKNEPAVLYDLLNEPQGSYGENDYPGTTPQIYIDWYNWALSLTDTVRAKNPDSLVFVSGVNYGYDLRYFMNNPLPRNNIVYSTHIYPQKWGSGGDYPANYNKFWGNMIYTANKPVFAGEFGPKEFEYNDTNRMNNYLDPLMADFDAKKIGWTAWSWHCDPRLTEGMNPNNRTVFGERVYQQIQTPPSF